MKRLIPILFLVTVTFSCHDIQNHKNEELIAFRDVVENKKSATMTIPVDSKQEIYTFLTFQKEDAEQAMNLYVELFENSEIIEIKRWEKGAPGKEGTIMQAIFSLNGKQFMCSDSPPIHDWDFTPAISNFVECKDSEEQERLFTKLSENGQVFMPLNNYGFSEKFGWVVDQFGISWQLNLN